LLLSPASEERKSKKKLDETTPSLASSVPTVPPLAPAGMLTVTLAPPPP
jgi:hypothetical protein